MQWNPLNMKTWMWYCTLISLLWMVSSKNSLMLRLGYWENGWQDLWRMRLLRLGRVRMHTKWLKIILPGIPCMGEYRCLIDLIGSFWMLYQWSDCENLPKDHSCIKITKSKINFLWCSLWSSIHSPDTEFWLPGICRTKHMYSETCM